MVDIEEQFARGFNGALVITQAEDMLNDALQKWDNIGNEMYGIVERSILGEISDGQALQLLDLVYGKAGEVKPPSPKLTTPSEDPSDELLCKTVLKMADELREGRKALAAKYEHCKATIKSAHGREMLPSTIEQTQAPDIAQSKPVPDTQAPERKAAETSTKDPIKVTLNWLAKKQWIKKEQLEAKPPVPINGGIWERPKEYEWRITKTIAFIYRGLMDAAENKEIPLEKDVIKNFMINNLKTKYGGDITSDSLTKADKSRQKPTK